jgi:hypothetical protein
MHVFFLKDVREQSLPMGRAFAPLFQISDKGIRVILRGISRPPNVKNVIKVPGCGNKLLLRNAGEMGLPDFEDRM